MVSGAGFFGQMKNAWIWSNQIIEFRVLVGAVSELA